MATGIREYKSEYGAVKSIHVEDDNGAIVICGKFDNNATAELMGALKAHNIEGRPVDNNSITEMAFLEIKHEKMNHAVADLIRWLHKNNLANTDSAMQMFKDLAVPKSMQRLQVAVNLDGPDPERDNGDWRDKLASLDWQNRRSHHYGTGAIPSPGVK